ncbi:hypothetical protein A9C11_10740 [Pseudomonas citronellolis]|uniref:Phage ABA sandwich domain-containing protein n=1 Tax=Pseudomonas citronellolis TaxID=53408 RepID=A0A1A9KBF4_9PSED|nr:hypothetical protein [Pseudomonas citronellolis]ANI14430.1 hypothetical protein A9C11_10740 [Pseudomonas citronellolis]
MTDRELLELAAKAAGIEGKHFESENGIHIHTGIYRPGLDYYWNPLISDSEAFRLAVDLQLCTSTGELACAASWPPHSAWLHEVVEKHDGDKRAAMRRAITRAAAEIGRQMG